MIMAEHDRILHCAIEAHGGRVLQAVGDGVYAVFASAGETALAAVQAQTALQQLVVPDVGPLRVRMAIHTGVGPTALKACLRLLGIARGEQVLISGATADCLCAVLPSSAALRPLGRHRMGELRPPEDVFQLVDAQMRSALLPLRSRWYQRWRRYTKELKQRLS